MSASVPRIVSSALISAAVLLSSGCGPATNPAGRAPEIDDSPTARDPDGRQEDAIAAERSTKILPASPGPHDGVRRTEADNLVVYRPGTLPLILAAPHGGREPVAGVPERIGRGGAKFVTARDENTAELAERTADLLRDSLGGEPYLVIARFDRSFVDANRPPESAYETPAAERYYDAYHAAVLRAVRDVQTGWGRGLLLDLHGQASVPGMVFRGTRDGKSVTLLRERFGDPAVTGPDSVAGRLERLGYAMVPAAGATGKEDPRYRGGYTVETYGSHGPSGVDAIQLEIGSAFRKKDRLDRTAADLADAVRTFVEAYLPRARLKRAPLG